VPAVAGAVDGLEDLRAPRADEAGQADDLTRPDAEADVLECAAQAQALDLEQRLAGGRGRLPRREDVLDGPPGHEGDDLTGRRLPGREPGGHRPPVLEDGDAVADLADLLEAVRDVDDGDVVRREVADDPEETLDLLVVQDGGRLVHDDQLGVLRQRTGDAHHLLRGGGERADLGGGADLRVAEAGQQLGRGTVGGRRAGDPQPRVLAPQEDVVGDAQPAHQVELLVDRRDAEAHRGLRVAQRHLLAAPVDLALVRLVGAGQDLDQRGLARAVLAEQAVHLSGADVEVHTVERPDTGERLDDAVHLEEGGALRRTSCVAHAITRLLLSADH
jgi:hypothetical protein